MIWINRLLHARQFIFALWFLAYFIGVQPGIMARLSQIPEQRNIALGLILVGVQVLELIGVWLKYPSVDARVRTNRSKSWVQFVSGLLVMTHMLVTALLSFTALELFGVDLKDAPLWSGLAGIMFFILALGKEGLFLGWWLQLMGMQWDNLPGLPKTISPMVAELVGDGFLAIFSALAYTVTWEQIAADSFILGTTSSQIMLEYLGAVLFFLMIFPATRAIYYVEELLSNQPLSARRQSVFWLLVTLISALFAIPRGV